MPEGSLTLNIQTLQNALSGITDLQGTPSDGATGGNGFAGAAGLASVSLTDQFSDLNEALSGQLEDIFSFDSSTLVEIPDLFNELRSQIQTPPTQAIQGFDQLISQADTALSGEFVGRLQNTLTTIQSISQNVPEDRTAIVSTLLDQILKIFGSLEGPEAEKVQSWIQSIQEMHRILLPLVAEAQASPNPSLILVQVIQRSLDSTIEVFGINQARSFMNFLDRLPQTLASTETLDPIAVALNTTSGAYDQTLALVGGTYPDFRNQVVSVSETLLDLKKHVRPVLGNLNRVVTAKIFQPQALEIYLREQMDNALAVKIQEVQKIDDPFNDLFDRMDEAIDGIDLSFVQTEVLEFFENAKTTIQTANIPSLGDTLQEQLAPVDDAVQQLQQGVTGLLTQIKIFFDGVNEQLRSVAGNVGQFQPDGSFQYNFENNLQEVLLSARVAINGDPNNPDEPSLTASLGEFQTKIDQFLNQLDQLLGPVESTITGISTDAVSGINDFKIFLDGLDVTARLEELGTKIEEVLDALIPIDFDLLIDPIVTELDSNTEKLRGIDTESLNDLLREALKVALDVIITIDFTAEIGTPLEEGFEEIRKIPQKAIDELQERYEQAISHLDQLNPEQLLEALFSSFDIINDAVGSLNVADLLAPLDELHKQVLQEPLAKLKPSILLEPVTTAFENFTSVFDDINGDEIIRPINTQLNRVKSAVEDLDITSWIDDLLAAIEKVKQDLRDIRPSEIMEPLVSDFQKLETELDRFKPSVVFQPATDLAAPLLGFLENVQQDVIDSLFQAFQAPLQILDRLEPEALTQRIQQELDASTALLEGLNFPARYNQLKGQHFDLKQAAVARGDERLVALVEFIDPEKHLGELSSTYNNLILGLENVKNNVALPDLTDLYAEFRERLMSLLPPYARELMNPDKFKRVMRLADPTRFLQELDERFATIKNKLIPIRPQDITEQLDATYEEVLTLVDNLDISESLIQVKDRLNNLKDIVNTIRIDFLAEDINNSVSDVRAMVEGLNPDNIAERLDTIYQDLEQVVQSTLPSQMLSGLEEPLSRVQSIVESVDPRLVLGPPLSDAWDSIKGVLEDIDFTIVLEPLVKKLDDLETEFKDSIQRTETSFDGMLGAAKGALSGSSTGGSTSVGASL